MGIWDLTDARWELSQSAFPTIIDPANFGATHRGRPLPCLGRISQYCPTSSDEHTTKAYSKGSDHYQSGSEKFGDVQCFPRKGTLLNISTVIPGLRLRCIRVNLWQPR